MLEMEKEMANKDEEVMDQDIDTGPPVLQDCVGLAGNDEYEVLEVDAENALRSPPKLLPAVVVAKRKSDESNKSPFKALTGSMKNTPASLSIIDGPSSSGGKSTRSTRSSIDPTFAAKQRSFLNKVHNALSVRTDDTSSCESDPEVVVDDEVSDDKSPEYIPGIEDVPKRLLLNGSNKRRREDSPVIKVKTSSGINQEHTVNIVVSTDVIEPAPKKKVSQIPINGKLRDIFCWQCHRDDADLGCASCPRAYHNRCLRRQCSVEAEWICPECLTILKAENQETRSKALKMLTLDQLCKLLLFAVDRMKACSGADVFENPVDLDQFPTYKDYIVNPMHLSLLEKNIKRKMYGSTEAFVADSSWIVHNCIIFNSFNSKLSSIAKNILKVCRHEMTEIENCPDCYNFSYTENENWFIQVCQKPHVLVWAKLKGFPFWPAKVVRANADAVDVRFFGAHDRAWVPARDCYLYSQENPNPNAPSKVLPTNPQLKKRNPRNNLDTCIEEVELHIQLLKQRFSTFQYATLKVPVSVKKLHIHLKSMLPDYAIAEPIAAPQTAKNTLTKRSSSDLKLSLPSGPSIKRMKADSSSPNPTNIMQLFKISSEAKENGGSKESVLGKGVHEHVTKAAAIGASQDSAKENGSACKANGTLALKENGNVSQSKRICNLMPVTVHTVTPGQSNTFITPLTKPNASTAELRFKQKDARKIGLIDRLQAKLGLLVARSASPMDESVSNLTEKDEGNQSLEQQKSESKSDRHVDESKGDSIISAEKLCKKPCDDVSTSKKNEDTPANTDLNNVKRDLFAGAKPVPKDAMNRFLINITKIQPTVVLEKLVLKTEKELPVNNIKISSKETESVSLDEEKECDYPIDKSHIADKINNVIVASMEIIPDKDCDNAAEELVPKVNASLAREPKLSGDPADPVTSTTSPSVTEPLPVEISVKKSASHSDEPELSLGRTEQKFVTKCVSKAPAPLMSNAPSELIINSEVKSGGVAASNVLGESIVQLKEEPSSEDESESHSEAEQSSELESSSNSGAQIATAAFASATVANDLVKSSNVPLKSKDVESRSQESKLKIVKKSFAIRAKPISELREDAVKKSKQISKQTNLANTEDSFVSSTRVSDHDSSSNNDTEVALKSLRAKNVTVRLETPIANDNRCAVIGPEKLLVLSRSSESNVQHTVSLSLPNAKAATIVVQSGSRMKPGESPLRNTPSSTIVTSPTHRAIHGATSVLKVKNMPTSDGGVSVKPRVFTLTSSGASQSAKPVLPPSLSSSISKTPTFVTVSHASTGIPIVRRLLPKAIPQTAGSSIQINAQSASPVVQATESPINTTVPLGSPTKVVSSRISVKPLITSVTASASATSPKVSASQDNQFKMPELRLLKASSSKIAVSPLCPGGVSDCAPKSAVASSTNLREMPPLSIASVCNLKPSSTTQANAGSSSPQTSSSTQILVSASESCPKVSMGKGPVSSELKSQANKMTEVFMGCLKDCLSEMGGMGNLEAQVRCLQLDMEHMQWRHKQEIEELRHNTELIISEIRDRMRVESQQVLNIALVNAFKEKEAAVAAAKEKQWCAYCKKEAMFYCCWNTSYCDYRCQQNHWPVHSLTCTQNASSTSEHNSLPRGENGPTQPASMGRIIIGHKELSPPVLKKR